MKVQDGHGQPWGKKEIGGFHFVQTSFIKNAHTQKKKLHCLLPEQGLSWDSVLHSVGASPGWLELWFQWRVLCLSHLPYDLGPTNPSIKQNILIYSYTTTVDLSAWGSKKRFEAPSTHDWRCRCGVSVAGWRRASAPETKGRLRRPRAWGRSAPSATREVGAGRSPGPAGRPEGTGERDGLPGGTRRLCRRPGGPRMRPASAGQRTDTGQSPSAAPAGESHSLETSAGGRNVGGRSAASVPGTVTLCLSSPYCVLVTYLLFERSSGHARENLHGNGTGRRRVLHDNCQAVRHNQIVIELRLKIFQFTPKKKKFIQDWSQSHLVAIKPSTWFHCLHSLWPRAESWAWRAAARA